LTTSRFSLGIFALVPDFSLEELYRL